MDSMVEVVAIFSEYWFTFVIAVVVGAGLLHFGTKHSRQLKPYSTEADKGQTQNIYEIRKMFLKSEKIYQIVMLFGNHRWRVNEI